MIAGNARCLQERPLLLATLASSEDKYDTEQSRAGAPVVVRKSDGAWFGSRYDPVKEAKRWAAAQEIKTEDLPIIVGFYPYALAAVKERPLIVVEKDASLIKAALAAIDLTGDLEGVVISLDEDGTKLQAAVRELYDPFRHARVKVVLSPYETDRDWTALMAEAGVIIQREFAMNLLSSAFQLPQWLITMMKNFPEYAASPDAAAIENIAEGETAIVVAAGPSLDRNIGELKRAKGKAVIIAVDTALRAMEAAGVLADIVVAVDTNEANASDVDGLSGSLSAILAADQIASSQVVRSFNGPKIFMRSINYNIDQEGRAVKSVHPIDEFLCELAGRDDVPSWQSGGSVSTNGFCLAHFMGIRRVILVGQDLAFTGGRTHVKGVGYEDARSSRSHRFVTLETLFQNTMSDGKIVVDSWDGGKVETNEVMREFLRWYENTMSRGFGRNMEVIDATEGGALIRGTKQMALKEAVDGLPDASGVLDRIRDAISRAPAAARPGVEERMELLRRRAEGFYRGNVDRIGEELPIARWLALPAFLGGRDLADGQRRELHAQALREAARFLVALLSPSEAAGY